MPGRFIDVVVEPHDELPDGCGVQFQAAQADGPRPVSLIRYQPSVGAAGLFRVEARARDGTSGPAQAVSVENRGAGITTLISGGDRGLRLFRTSVSDSGVPARGEEAPIAESYLLVAAEDIVS